jgi:hypothetical protein
MARKQRYTCAEVQQALIACNGLIYLAAEKLGCSSKTVLNYCGRYPSIREVVAEKRGKRVDVGEAALDKAVLAGEAWAVQFLLRTQGKDRGYVERYDHRHGGAEDLPPIRFSLEDAVAALQRAKRDRMFDGPGGNGQPDGDRPLPG